MKSDEMRQNKMNQYKATREYMQTLKQVRKERGLVGAVKHDWEATKISFETAVIGRIVNALVFYDSYPELTLRDIRANNAEGDRYLQREITDPNLFSA